MMLTNTSGAKNAAMALTAMIRNLPSIPPASLSS
jgi:hypothetical protein